MTKLPENFRLPDQYDYDDVIQGIDEDIEQEGGAGLFLGMIRYDRRHSASFHGDVLYPGAHHALML